MELNTLGHEINFLPNGYTIFLSENFNRVLQLTSTQHTFAVVSEENKKLVSDRDTLCLVASNVHIWKSTPPVVGQVKVVYPSDVRVVICPTTDNDVPAFVQAHCRRLSFERNWWLRDNLDRATLVKILQKTDLISPIVDLEKVIADLE